MKLLPLIEPDMQISSIRLTDTRRRPATQGVARAAAVRATAVPNAGDQRRGTRGDETGDCGVGSVPQKAAESHLQVVVEAPEDPPRIPVPK